MWSISELRVLSLDELRTGKRIIDIRNRRFIVDAQGLQEQVDSDESVDSRFQCSSARNFCGNCTSSRFDTLDHRSTHTCETVLGSYFNEIPQPESLISKATRYLNRNSGNNSNK